jgi:transposase
LNKQDAQKRTNRDLKTRAENYRAKLELAKLEAVEREREHKAALATKDAEIASLKKESKKDSQKRDGVIDILKRDNDVLAGEVRQLKEELAQVKSALDKATDDAQRLRAMLTKDSSTSSKPPSTDNLNKTKRTYSSRVKSGKKLGGQPGHIGHALRQKADPDVIADKMFDEICTCGGHVISRDTYNAKQLIDIMVQAKVTEERAWEGVCEKCGKVHTGEFSEAFVNPANYGPGVKAIVATLNAWCNTTVGKTASFIKSVSSGKIALSCGTVVNIAHELAGRLDNTIEVIKQGLIAGKALCVDETGLRCAGGLKWGQIFANEDYSLFMRNSTRTTLADAGNDLLLLFSGILVHDHLLSYYKHTHLSHAECNIHILRALKAVIVIQDHEWAKALAAVLRDANARKHILIAADKKSMCAEEVAAIKANYLKALDSGDAEYLKAIEGKENTSYFDEERRLLKRLREYVDNHLLFITDFDAPFGNNTAEQGAGFVKGKIRSAGCFRSDKGVDDYLMAASLIATLRKQGMNVYDTIKGLFEGIEPAFAVAAAAGR